MIPSEKDLFSYAVIDANNPDGSDSKESACNARDPRSIPGSGGYLEKGMATHSSFLAWRNLWIGEPGRLQSMVSQRLRHS